MGVVYRARDEQTARRVAIKLIDRANVADVPRAQREATTLARLDHSAIVSYIADGVTANALFLAMDWVDGITVGERQRGPGFTLRETIAMVARIAGALGAAHASGIVHRDVKPSNVLLPGGDPARAVLIDFGVAREDAVGVRLTRTGTTVGTPGYMAPEQARGHRTLTPAVDVFSLGCLLYECATGRPAFSGTLRSAVLTKVMFADPEPFDVLCPEASPEVGRLVDRMLAKDPTGRLVDGCAVEAALAPLVIADGPRRSTGTMVDETTQRSPPADQMHCFVMAAHGQPDEPAEPPAEDHVTALRAAVARWRAEPVVLQTGMLVIHLAGASTDVATRAAWCALEVKRIVVGATIAITALEPALGAIADAGTQLLASASLAAIFGRSERDTITIDASLAPHLAERFVLAGDPPRLSHARS
jgi:hypothetical protein